MYEKPIAYTAIGVSGCNTQQRYVLIPSGDNVNILDTQTGDVYGFSVEDNRWYKLPPIIKARPFLKD